MSGPHIRLLFGDVAVVVVVVEIMLVWFGLVCFPVVWFGLGFFKWLLSNVQSASHELICLDNVTSYHTEAEVVDEASRLAKSQYTDTRPTNPSSDPQRQAPDRVATTAPMFTSLA